MSVIGLNDVLNSSYKEQVRGKLKSSVIHHLNHKLKSDSFPQGTHRVNEGQLSVKQCFKTLKPQVIEVSYTQM